MQHKVTAQIGSTQISIETGKIAKLADGAVIVSCGDTMVLASAVSATQIKEGQDWFPLTVDYREKAAAVGKFPGGYFKREGRPSEKETLTSRMTDRPLRPLFPAGYLYDTQIISILLSADGQNDPDILAINGASAALTVSDIPFAGPIGAVRVGRVDGQFIANPTHDERNSSDIDLVYVGTENDVIMIEGSAMEIPAEDFVNALEFDYGQKTGFRISVLDKEKRMDGSGDQDVRPITCEVGVVARAHVSAIFQRGETLALALVTLAPIEEAQNIDAYGGGETSKSFLL